MCPENTGKTPGDNVLGETELCWIGDKFARYSRQGVEKGKESMECGSKKKVKECACRVTSF